MNDMFKDGNIFISSANWVLYHVSLEIDSLLEPASSIHFPMCFISPSRFSVKQSISFTSAHKIILVSTLRNF